MEKPILTVMKSSSLFETKKIGPGLYLVEGLFQGERDYFAPSPLYEKKGKVNVVQPPEQPPGGKTHEGKTEGFVDFTT